MSLISDRLDSLAHSLGARFFLLIPGFDDDLNSCFDPFDCSTVDSSLPRVCPVHRSLHSVVLSRAHCYDSLILLLQFHTLDLKKRKKKKGGKSAIGEFTETINDDVVCHKYTTKVPKVGS